MSVYQDIYHDIMQFYSWGNTRDTPLILLMDYETLMKLKHDIRSDEYSFHQDRKIFGVPYKITEDVTGYLLCQETKR